MQSFDRWFTIRSNNTDTGRPNSCVNDDVIERDYRLNNAGGRREGGDDSHPRLAPNSSVGLLQQRRPLIDDRRWPCQQTPSLPPPPLKATIVCPGALFAKDMIAVVHGLGDGWKAAAEAKQEAVSIIVTLASSLTLAAD